jgi:hypothetical protein
MNRSSGGLVRRFRTAGEIDNVAVRAADGYFGMNLHPCAQWLNGGVDLKQLVGIYHSENGSLFSLLCRYCAFAVSRFQLMCHQSGVENLDRMAKSMIHCSRTKNVSDPSMPSS